MSKVESKSESVKLLDHDYDGIQEYDNALPFWWKAIFWITIAFSPVYIWYYHLGGPGPSIQEIYAADVAAAEERRAVTAEANLVSESTLAELAGNSEALAAGSAVFAAKCVACHAPEGQGLIGPNLTDDYFIHGGTSLDTFHVIRDGVPEKGMVAWGKMLSHDELLNVAAFVISLRGTSPDNPKPPEGEKY